MRCCNPGRRRVQCYELFPVVLSTDAVVKPWAGAGSYTLSFSGGAVH